MEVIVVLHSALVSSARRAIVGVAPPRQMASDAVFVAEIADGALDGLRGMEGVARVLTGREAADALPPMSDGERLFVQAWLSSRGQVKERRGEGRSWDTPGMEPPDHQGRKA